MVIVSAKVSKRKILLGLLIAVCVIVLLSFLLNKSEEPVQNPQQQIMEQDLDGSSNDNRISFLKSFGWEVNQTPVETQEVRIPQEFNEVFTRYNEMQIEQGFDLSKFAGKTAKRYVYAITNYPGGSQDHFATVLVHKNQIIGGDVAANGGTMHGFAMPD